VAFIAAGNFTLKSTEKDKELLKFKFFVEGGFNE